jgi:hypothetical protein
MGERLGERLMGLRESDLEVGVREGERALFGLVWNCKGYIHFRRCRQCKTRDLLFLHGVYEFAKTWNVAYLTHTKVMLGS